MVTVADGHQTFYCTLMINMVMNINLTSFSTSQENISRKKMRRTWDLDIDLNLHLGSLDYELCFF